MRQELIAQLNAWHEEDEFEQIVSRIKEVPTPLIDDELAVHLGRALNNLGRYKEALKWFNKTADKGKKIRCGISASVTRIIIWTSMMRRSRLLKRLISWTLRIRTLLSSWNGAGMKRACRRVLTILRILRILGMLRIRPKKRKVTRILRIQRILSVRLRGAGELEAIGILQSYCEGKRAERPAAYGCTGQSVCLWH